MRHSKGFSLVELLVVIAIIGVLATIVTVAVQPAIKKGRDTARKAVIAQVGRFLTGSSGCFTPDAGDGEYDLAELFPEVIAKFPQVAQFISKVPHDPRGGSDTNTKYTYIIEGGNCAIYTNLENEGENITLPGLTAPTPGGGSGILQGSAEGVNGTRIFMQASNTRTN